jgi:cell division protein FtsI/penicillin-binding protein 2
MGEEIGRKVGRVIVLVGLALFCILLRVWYLASFQHDEYVEKARRPQRRTVIEPIGRASIRDRFNLPLAINKVQFKAAVRYADIRQIPNYRYEISAEGKRVKIPVRTKYIENLSQILAKELGIDAREIEDTIHAKAALVPHMPFVIAESINEEQYYRLRMMEKDWPGIVAERDFKRHYPFGKVACDAIGMMGAISGEEYMRIVGQIKELQEYVAQREEGKTPFLPKGYFSPVEVREKLIELKRKAYTLRDLVGKSGVEAAFDQELKGSNGKHLFEVDVKGNILRELPMSIAPVPGKRVILTLSAELQAYAEELLARAEVRRCKVKGSLEEPWIRGGAIVAMDAKSGEILALASYPRFDPSDFLPGKERRDVLKWLENEAWLAELWDGHAAMNREIYLKNGLATEEMPITWKHFKEAVLPSQGDLKSLFDSVDTLQHIFAIQNPEREEEFLIADLSRLIARSEDYPEALKAKLGNLSCDDFFQQRQAYLRLKRKVEQESRKLFSKTLFEDWRAKRFKTFLKKKRIEEKREQRAPKPYTEYLEERKRTMFREFWVSHHLSLLEALIMKEEMPLSFFQDIKAATGSIFETDASLQALSKILPQLTALERKALLKSFKGYRELTMPLLGSYPRVRKEKGKQTLRNLAASFYPVNGYGFGRSQAFRQSTPAGSVFKLVIAYQALLERYEALKEQHKSLSLLNPLILTDDSPQKGLAANLQLGRTEEGKPITRVYKGGRLPRSSHAGIGKIDLIGALEQSSNIYFSLLASEHIKEPGSLAPMAQQFGYGEKSGIELPGEIAGKLPKDLDEDITAIYAYAIGQHSLVVTPLQTAVMIGAVVSGGKVIKPSIVQFKAGQDMLFDPGELFERLQFQNEQLFTDVGIHFPIFTLAESKQEHTSLAFSPIQIRRSLFVPPEIKEYLLEGMKKAIHGARGTARPAAVRRFCFDETIYRDYLSILPHLAGKTGTAEILYKQSIDSETKASMRKHTWFAGASFAKDKSGNVNWNEPEIIVVSYLRFASAGSEAAPLAGLIIKKWEEICSKHGGSSYVRAPLDDRIN